MNREVNSEVSLQVLILLASQKPATASRKSTISKTTKTTKITVSNSDNFKSLSEYSKNINTEAFFHDYNDYKKLSMDQQLEILRLRKTKLYNLAMYLKQEVAKFLPKNVLCINKFCLISYKGERQGP